MDGGAWRATPHGVEKTQTRLTNILFAFRVWLISLIAHCPPASSALLYKVGLCSFLRLNKIPLLGFPGGSVVNNPPAMKESQKTQVQLLGRDDPLEEDMATHSGILAWRIPWTEESAGLPSIGSQRPEATWDACNILLHTHIWIFHFVSLSIYHLPKDI